MRGEWGEEEVSGGEGVSAREKTECISVNECMCVRGYACVRVCMYTRTHVCALTCGGMAERTTQREHRRLDNKSAYNLL